MATLPKELIIIFASVVVTSRMGNKVCTLYALATVKIASQQFDQTEITLFNVRQQFKKFTLAV